MYLEGGCNVLDHLVGYGLRDRVRVICSGKLITPSAVAWALCLGGRLYRFSAWLYVCAGLHIRHPETENGYPHGKTKE